MRVFHYNRWSGTPRTVECDRVIFTPGHVVFERVVHDESGAVSGTFIVLAEKNEHVGELKEIETV